MNCSYPRAKLGSVAKRPFIILLSGHCNIVIYARDNEDSSSKI